MADLISALARLRAFRSTWDDEAVIDEESGLTATDLATILAAVDGPAEHEQDTSPPFNDLGSFAS